MKITDTLAQQLYQQMHLYLQQMTELQDILQRERTAIKERDFERFRQILEHKDNLLAEVAGFDQAVTTLLKKVLRKPNREALDALFASYQGPHASTLKLQWQAVQRLTNECKRANDINSKIVGHMQHYYARLNSILRRQDPDSTTYAKDGRQAGVGNCGGTLAQA